MSFLIDVPNALLFVEPDNNAPVADEALYGMECEVLARRGNFFEVNMFYGYRAYVEAKAVTRGVMPDFFICKKFADILPKPSFSQKPIMVLPMGSRIRIGKAVAPYFVEVITNNNKVYYTHKCNVASFVITPKEQLREKLALSAAMYCGTSYRWGGKSPSGIDCSGLTFMSYYLNGYLVYRDAQAEKFDGFTKTTINEAQMGDLLFFPGHIAMYLYNGVYIHSSGPNGGVSYNSLVKDTPLYNSYLAENLNTVLTLNRIKQHTL